MESFAAVIDPGSPLNPPILGDFEREILPESPPELGGWGAEALSNEAENLCRIHVVLSYQVLECEARGTELVKK
ncbi:hypothetical protein ACJ2PR_14545 [Phormidesmis sp. 146-33]